MRGLKRICLFGYLLLITPALSNETLHCTFDVLDEIPGHNGEATIEITGADLAWILPPITTPNLRVPGVVFHYDILKENDEGIVAALADIENDERTGKRVGASVLAIQKSSFGMRMASVNTEGVHDLLSGSCQPK